ncbi:MAG: hypothetical protein J6Y45_02895 [Bacteroidales bacterium]|nr:hypothetical protein [Bacteroidales bacterium]
MDLSFSEEFLQVIETSREEALRTGWHNICPDHIMLAILRLHSPVVDAALQGAGVDPSLFKESIDEAIFINEQIPWSERDSINLSDSTRSMLQHASLEAVRCHESSLSPLHFLLAVCRIAGCYSHDFLNTRGIGLRPLVEGAGRDWSLYGLAPRDKSEAAAPDPQALAAAIEQRIREGYTTDNPIVS